VKQIRLLKDILEKDMGEVGNRAVSLSELSRNGINVPPTLLLPRSFFKNISDEEDLLEDLYESYLALGVDKSDIKSLLKDVEIKVDAISADSQTDTCFTDLMGKEELFAMIREHSQSHQPCPLLLQRKCAPGIFGKATMGNKTIVIETEMKSYTVKIDDFALKEQVPSSEIDDNLLRQVAKICKKCSSILKCPQKVDWIYCKHGLYVRFSDEAIGSPDSGTKNESPSGSPIPEKNIIDVEENLEEDLKFFNEIEKYEKPEVIELTADENNNLDESIFSSLKESRPVFGKSDVEAEQIADRLRETFLLGLEYAESMQNLSEEESSRLILLQKVKKNIIDSNYIPTGEFKELLDMLR
jgi:hypothetical protein